MRVYGNFKIIGTRATEIMPNQTVTRPVTLAGHANNGGTCSGSAYSDPYGTWTDIVVSQILRLHCRLYC